MSKITTNYFVRILNIRVFESRSEIKIGLQNELSNLPNCNEKFNFSFYICQLQQNLILITGTGYSIMISQSRPIL